MLPDAIVEEDDVEVPDTVPLFSVEDVENVSDFIFLSPGSCRSRKVFLCTGRPRMLLGSTLMSSGCSGISAVVVGDDGGDKVASTAGFWSAPVAALLPLTGAGHGGSDAGDGGDGVDGVCVDVRVP